MSGGAAPPFQRASGILPEDQTSPDVAQRDVATPVQGFKARKLIWGDSLHALRWRGEGIGAAWLVMLNELVRRRTGMPHAEGESNLSERLDLWARCPQHVRGVLACSTLRARQPQGLLFWSSCGGNHGQTFFRTGKQFFLKLREGLVMKVFG